MPTFNARGIRVRLLHSDLVSSTLSATEAQLSTKRGPEVSAREERGTAALLKGHPLYEKPIPVGLDADVGGALGFLGNPECLDVPFYMVVASVDQRESPSPNTQQPTGSIEDGSDISPSLGRTTPSDPQKGIRLRITHKAAQALLPRGQITERTLSPSVHALLLSFNLARPHTAAGLHIPLVSPHAIAACISISTNNLRPYGQRDLKVITYLNGTLSKCSVLYSKHFLPKLKASSTGTDGKTPHCFTSIAAGRRTHHAVERPWVLVPPGLEVNGSLMGSRQRSRVRQSTSEERWDQIAQSLLYEADKHGLNASGGHPPSAEYLQSLASLPMPEEFAQFQKSGSHRFAVIDVMVVTGKIKAGMGIRTPWLTDPAVSKDPRYNRPAPSPPVRESERECWATVRLRHWREKWAQREAKNRAKSALRNGAEPENTANNSDVDMDADNTIMAESEEILVDRNQSSSITSATNRVTDEVALLPVLPSRTDDSPQPIANAPTNDAVLPDPFCLDRSTDASQKPDLPSKQSFTLHGPNPLPIQPPPASPPMNLRSNGNISPLTPRKPSPEIIVWTESPTTGIPRSKTTLATDDSALMNGKMDNAVEEKRNGLNLVPKITPITRRMANNQSMSDENPLGEQSIPMQGTPAEIISNIAQITTGRLNGHHSTRSNNSTDLQPFIRSGRKRRYSDLVTPNFQPQKVFLASEPENNNSTLKQSPPRMFSPQHASPFQDSSTPAQDDTTPTTESSRPEIRTIAFKYADKVIRRENLSSPIRAFFREYYPQGDIPDAHPPSVKLISPDKEIIMLRSNTAAFNSPVNDTQLDIPLMPPPSPPKSSRPPTTSSQTRSGRRVTFRIPQTPVSDSESSDNDRHSSPESVSPTARRPRGAGLAVSARGYGIQSGPAHVIANEQFQTPDLCRSAVITYAEDGDWGDAAADGGNEVTNSSRTMRSGKKVDESAKEGSKHLPIRQVPDERCADFREEYVVLGVRFVVPGF
ncbi:hypothetical protein P152DRAFT_453135 [Eremomyces bilateralis CBS 781.70]|uniref:Uncharacterized protein n=1 Tax=Eremomyces bilateralis CBS 781.70 TaxID=1392243 RepID=A0A6G1FR31_9PEZI|nr:uncharacterized protein P152DRAFT_453135 [Eremomyces bilateralis CBS 781.70]KAF1808122.1 hypothetical protein P152DRAFT_453135 [Eremomyces bilateralis CBS 781.70]